MTDSDHETRRGKLKVWFDDPNHGVFMWILQPPIELGIDASHVPYPTLLQLADGLCNLLQFGGTADVYCDEEPGLHVLRFAKSGPECTLQVDYYRDELRLRKPPEATLLRATGSVSEIIAPFWKALRSLQGRFSEAEYAARMSGRTFPIKETEMLGQLLKKGNSRS